jgi:lipopolysaccharide transport protein LptA
MAIFCRSTLVLVLGIGASVLHAGVPAVQKPAIDKPISLEAQSTEFDYRNSTLVFRKVKIEQGEMSVEADQAQATGLDFENSRWTFRGNVKINVPQGLLTSDNAEVTFANKVLANARINGTPAEFEQHVEKNGQLARGRANRIDYDVAQGVVRLSDNAWLSDGKNEIRGESLKYSVRDQRVIAEAAEQGSQRVRITITPPNKPKP